MHRKASGQRDELQRFDGLHAEHNAALRAEMQGRLKPAFRCTRSSRIAGVDCARGHAAIRVPTRAQGRQTATVDLLQFSLVARRRRARNADSLAPCPGRESYVLRVRINRFWAGVACGRSVRSPAWTADEEPVFSRASGRTRWLGRRPGRRWRTASSTGSRCDRGRSRPASSRSK
jgi:hypothetical protein